MRRHWRNNGLSIVLTALFLVCLGGQSWAGWLRHNEDRATHGGPPATFGDYLTSSAWLEATAENWESEFLQMASYVVLTVFLYQKGSAESKDPDAPDEESVNRPPDPARAGAPGPVRRGGLALRLYRHSLGLTLFALFVVSFLLHAVGGAGEYNDEQAQHGSAARVTWLSYMRTARFWFESLQNWQSEFLAVLTIVVLSIYLREHGSPESKPLDAAHDDTGN